MTDHLPRADAAETGVISSILLAPKYFDHVADLIGEDDFFQTDERTIFAELTRMSDAGEAIDVTRLIGRPGIDDTKLAEILHSEAVPVHAIPYAEDVREASRRRKLCTGLTDAMTAAFNSGMPTEDAIQLTETALDAFHGDGEAEDVLTIGDALKRLRADLERRKCGENSHVLTGFPLIDHDVGGFGPGELIVLGARPRAGKTALGLTIGEHIAKHGRGVLFVSLEMRAVELARRIAARASGVSGVAMRCGVEASDLQRIDDAAQGFNDMPLRIWDPPRATLAEIRRRVRAERRRGVDVLIVDYLQLIRPSDPRKSRYEHVTEISAGLKALAKECGVPVVCLAQLGRDAETDIPRLHHLRESGSIEQDADMVFLLDRPELRDPKDPALAGQALLFLAKNRHGPTGEYALTFDGPTMTFSEPDADDWGTGQDFEANDFTNFPTSDDWSGTNFMEATSCD